MNDLTDRLSRGDGPTKSRCRAQEEQERPRGDERIGSAQRRLPRRRRRRRRLGRIGVLVAALGRGGVALGGAAELAVSEVPAAGMVDARQALQLEEVLLLATELTVAALLRAVTLTVALAVDVAVALLLHAEPLVDVPPVVVPEADLLAGALLCPGASLLAVLGRYHAVVVPGVADVLKAGISVAQAAAIALVNAGREGGRQDLIGGRQGRLRPGADQHRHSHQLAQEEGRHGPHRQQAVRRRHGRSNLTGYCP